ncbi:hypothetical protein [Pinisolibacter sp.]|uniref:hypothetical protein n=1 Tax=Pinisolibacter sp. TaxID=2172024 RepID=UPI002FDE4586
MRIGRTNGIGNGFGVERRALDPRALDPCAFDRRVEPAAGAAGTGAERDRAEPWTDTRALVPATAPKRHENETERLVRWHAHAPFLAQLVATREDLPETRRRRRAEPARAARAYADVMDGPGLLVPGYLVDTAR